MHMKKEAIIFYSWQSDHGDTRNYVENSIKGAIKDLTTNPELEEAPRPSMDKDAQGEIGAVDIARVIHEKIDKTDVFIADVSLVSKSGKKKLVNQNVMYELGYAIGKHTDAKVILVANTDLGSIDEMPFDIRGKKIIGFSPAADPKRVAFKEELRGAISAHISRISGEVAEVEKLSLSTLLIEAIENEKPARTKAGNYFDSVYSDIKSQYPGRL